MIPESLSLKFYYHPSNFAERRQPISQIQWVISTLCSSHTYSTLSFLKLTPPTVGFSFACQRHWKFPNKWKSRWENIWNMAGFPKMKTHFEVIFHPIFSVFFEPEAISMPHGGSSLIYKIFLQEQGLVGPSVIFMNRKFGSSQKHMGRHSVSLRLQFCLLA